MVTSLDWAHAGSPNGIHYAWDAKVPGHNWTFNKHNHKSFLAETCELEFGQKGLFRHPPWPSELASKVRLQNVQCAREFLSKPDASRIIIQILCHCCRVLTPLSLHCRHANCDYFMFCWFSMLHVAAALHLPCFSMVLTRGPCSPRKYASMVDFCAGWGPHQGSLEH